MDLEISRECGGKKRLKSNFLGGFRITVEDNPSFRDVHGSWAG